VHDSGGVVVFSYPPLKVKVWGEFACFTRPEMKVERVTYPIMTPSAARGVLEAIFWKPEFSWRIREIQILHPIEYCSIVRNEVKSRMGRLDGDFYADEYRTQRTLSP
jgi:CRISPR-associated protein Cas5d